MVEGASTGGRSVEFYALLGAALAAAVYSAIEPADTLTWVLEAAPVMIGLPVLLATRHRFPLTPLVMWLLFGHAIVLLVGAHYTYAQVPVGFWAAELFDLERNPYDRFAHFIQGFVPAMLAREILIRLSPLQSGKWLFFIVACFALAFSALYELIEFAAALIGGAEADAFLGAQGDTWDSQWDMLLALVGALLAQAILAPVHDRAIEDLEAP